MNKLNRILSIFLIVVIVATIGCIAYLAVTPKKGDKFTEFYILGTEGKAEGYPKQALVGKPVDTIIGIVNHEYQPASYLVKITINGTEVKEVNVGTLAHKEKWGEEINFTPQVAGEKQRVEFHLYKDSGDKPYLKEPLRLYIDVTSP